MTHNYIICVMSSHKPIRINMGDLILGVNTLYRLFCFFKLFPMVGKGLNHQHISPLHLYDPGGHSKRGRFRKRSRRRTVSQSEVREKGGEEEGGPGDGGEGEKEEEREERMEEVEQGKGKDKGKEKQPKEVCAAHLMETGPVFCIP